MKITFIAETKYFDRDSCSGTAYWIPICLKRAGITVNTIHVSIPDKLLPPWEEFGLRCKQFFSRWSKKGYFEPEMQVRRAEYIAEKLKGPLSTLDSDIILTALSPQSSAFLQAKQPIVYWTDWIYSACTGFYPSLRSDHIDTRWDGHILTNACLMNASTLIFSSQWAARSAIELHGISPHKIHVVPFGPNLEIDHDEEVVKSWIKKREGKTIKLLFIGQAWYRKGGDIVLAVAKRLHELGQAVEVTLVGSKPMDEALPDYAKAFDFISKNSPENNEKIKNLYRESHFLFVPSRAEAFGIVFCEASAFGLPSLTTFVGGISDVVKNGVNGLTFSLEATIDEISNTIITTFNNTSLYQTLCLSSFNEYKTRLNWDVSGQRVKEILTIYLG